MFELAVLIPFPFPEIDADDDPAGDGDKGAELADELAAELPGPAELELELLDEHAASKTPISRTPATLRLKRIA